MDVRDLIVTFKIFIWVYFQTAKLQHLMAVFSDVKINKRKQKNNLKTLFKDA